MPLPLQLKKAQRSKAYLKLGMSAPSGGGKTLGALLIAYGIMKEKYPDKDNEFLWDKICIIDTENGSGELYVGAYVANTQIGVYNAITLTAPFEADKYTTAIELCADNGIEVCIIDSTTHLWTGQGGLLEQQGNAAKKSGNSYTAWHDITPQHKRFIESMLQTPMHIIATARSKQEYTIDRDDKGKASVRKLGLEPEQRKGFEFEFTAFFEIDADHQAFGSKDRSSIFDQKFFKITPKVGQEYMKWLSSGTSEETVVKAEPVHKVDPKEVKEKLKLQIIELCKDLGGRNNTDLMSLLKEFTPSGNPNAMEDETKLAELHAVLVDWKEKVEVIKREEEAETLEEEQEETKEVSA